MVDNTCTPNCTTGTTTPWPFVMPRVGGDDTALHCLPPMQFCFTTSETGPVQYPGRTYDLTLPINPGFAVQSMQVDQTTNPANIVWDVSDPDGERFRQSLTTFMEGRLPAAAIVTITNPNAGNVVCGTATAMTIHIECLRLDQNPPNLIELVYNAGEDLVINPAYNESPPLNPPVSQGNYGFHLLAREDDPGPFPGNPPAGRAVCTSVANRGWETNDVGRTFEIWGRDQVQGQGVTPTPRGTPVQEMTSDGAPAGKRSTIWQTFVAPSSGTFKIRVVHGARDAGETHIITLDNGDTADSQFGDIIEDVTNNVGVVTNSSGAAGPWTTFDREIPLVGGSTYTLALSTNNPAGGARGGLFTDMRAYLDVPDQRATAATDDATCQVEVTETHDTTTCEFWQPTCTDGAIASWTDVQSGVTMTNAEFWAQTPPPSCCNTSSSTSGGGGGSANTPGNLVINYDVCGIVGGVATTLERVVLLDQTGGVIGAAFVGPGGAPVTPAPGWTIGACPVAVGPYGSEFEATDICIRLAASEQNIRSNDGDIRNGSVDAEWDWTPDDVNTEHQVTWYPTYRVAPFSASWTATDTHAPPISGWVAPHPNGGLANTGAAGEGPTIDTSASLTQYVMRTSMTLPANVDVGSVTVQAYVMNAAERVARWRINNEQWRVPVNPTGQDDAADTFGPIKLIGVQPGLNRFYFQPTLPFGWTDGAGLNVHFVVKYRTTDNPRQWKQIIHSDGSISFIDEFGNAQTALPAGMDISGCDAPEPYSDRINMLYTTTVETVDNRLLILGSRSPSGMELVAWSVRHRADPVLVTGSTTVLDTPSTVQLDPGEVITFDSGDDPSGFIADSVSIDTRGGGSARLTYQYRRTTQALPLA